jgi:uncharacterized membrane protein YagU involved in acid resistance
MTTLANRTFSMSNKLIGGVAGGLAGGLVFGVMMAMMGMMPMIASLAGSQSSAVGWLIHLLISIFIGVTFALLLGDRSVSYGSGLRWGIIYGAIWWVLGPLLIMPAMMGMPLFMFNSTTIMSLVGHLIYGALLGLGYAWYINRS